MRVLALFAGLPQTYLWEGKEVTTSIFKDPAMELEAINQKLIGNIQANLLYHGGPFKEVYSYALENYEYWKQVLSPTPVGLGILGENITTEGLDEKAVLVGEQYQIGTMILEISQPRLPCFKFNLRINRKNGEELFDKSQSYGIYWKIIKDGIIFPGDKITKVKGVENLPAISLSDLYNLLKNKTATPDLIDKVTSFPGIDPKIIERARNIIP